MPFWKPHALAKPHADQLDLRIGDRVTSTVELPGVSVGTAGKVILANGAELGDLDGRQLEPTGKAAKRLAKAAKRAAA